MQAKYRVLLAAAFVAMVLPRAAAAVDEAAGQERLGLRAGYLATADGLNDTYGDGWDITIFFTERLVSRILLDVRLGAMYFGDAPIPDNPELILFAPGTYSQMRFFYFSAGPLAGFRMGNSYSGYLSLGIGIYTVSMGFTSSISGYDYSDQHIGYNGGAGMAWRIASNWSVELNGTVHYFAVDQNLSDLYWIFTDGADSPLVLGIALGVTVDLR
jgi:opacity protein-like surface antigen